MAPHFLFVESYRKRGQRCFNYTITMNGKDFILLKQQNWAKRKGFELVPGTIGSDGEKNYVSDLVQNLFEPLSEDSLVCYRQGDGNETKDGGKRRAKMKALHSSSAIVVNLFQYWQKKEYLYPLLRACKLPVTSHVGKEYKNIGAKTDCTVVETSKRLSFNGIKFEEKFEISPDKALFPHTPNIDVVIYGDYDFAIESKFTEPYNNKHDGLKAKYVEDTSLWQSLPNSYELAKEISPYNNKFRYLDAAQLLKHILGLKKKYGTPYSTMKTLSGRALKMVAKPYEFYLVYLWYDVLGEEGFKHREEIEQFARIADADGIRFRHITYQEVIANLSKDFYEGNEAYCDYLTERYL